MLDIELSFNAAADVTYTALAADNSVFVDPTGPDSVEITSQPARGHVVALPNGNISFYHNDNLETSTLSFTYNRTTGMVTTPVTATIAMSSPLYTGWDKRGYYLPPVDYSVSHLAYAWPGQTTRLIHADSDSLLTYDSIRLSEAGIADDAGLVTVAQWIVSNPATGQGGKYYGQTPALALEQQLAEEVMYQIMIQGRFKSPWLLYKRGGVYGPISRSLGYICEGKVHPSIFGAYGTGDLPYFLGAGPKMWGAAYMMVQNIEYSNGMNFNDLTYCVSDYNKARGSAATAQCVHLTGGASTAGRSFARDITVRGLKAYDCHTMVPDNGNTSWSTTTRDRSSAFYGQWYWGLLLEGCHSDMSGWAEGYHPTLLYTDGTNFWPKGPEIYSHGAYNDNSGRGMHIRDNFITRPCGAGIQNRGGGIWQGNHISFAGLGDPIGAGWYGANGDVDGRHASQWSFNDTHVKTKAGFKNYYTNPIIADSGGYERRPEGQSCFRIFLGNAGTPNPYVTGTELGPRSHPNGPRGFNTWSDIIAFTTPGPVRPTGSLAIFNWSSNFAPIGTEGLTEGELALLTVEKYAETLLGEGATYYELCEHLRTLEVPSNLIDGMLRFFLSPFGYMASSARTTPQTCTFQPHATGTPGCRMDIRLDWDTDDLPGTVAGDDADLGDHIGMQGSFNPKNKITDFSFRELTWNGGLMDLLGDTIVPAGGGELNVEGGAHYYMNAKTGGTLDLTVKEGVFVNRDDLANVNIDARFGSIVLLAEGGKTCTIDSGRTLTVHGHSEVGFDALPGTTATLTLSSGGKLVFKPCIKVPLSKATMTLSGAFTFANGAAGNRQILPRIGATVTGANGSTGDCVDVFFGQSQTLHTAWVYLENLSGVDAFASGEMLSGPCDHLYTYDFGTQDFGQVDGTAIQTAGMGCIKKVRSGRYGFDANGWVIDHDETAVVNLNGADLDVHIGMLGNVTDLPLIDVDSVVHNANFGTVTVYGHQISGSEKDVTIDVTTTQVLLTIEDAVSTGSVTVNYPV